MKRFRTLALFSIFLVATMISSCVSTEPEEDKTDARKAAETNTELGQQYMNRGQNEVALEKLKRAIAHDRTYAPAHTVLAFLYETIGESDLAEEQYREAIRYDPDDGSVNNNYGAFLCAHGRQAKAEEYFRKALSDPFYDTPELALSNAGRCELEIGNLDKAESYLRQSIEYDQEFPASLLALGQLNYQRGDYLKARAFLQRYEAVTPHTEESLLLGYRVERQLGDTNAAETYRRRIVQEFPGSDAARSVNR